MIRHIPMIVKSSVRNRRRSTLTIGSVAISVALLGTLMAVYNAFFLAPPPQEQAMRLVVRNRVSLAVSMPIAYGERIAKVPGVVDVMPFQWFGGLYREAKNVFARYAAPPEKLFRVRPELVIPAEEKRAWARDRAGCLVGRGLSKRYGFKVGDRITLKGDIFPVNPELTVRAIYDNPTDDELLFFQLDYLYELLPEARRHRIFGFLALADRPENVARIAQEIDSLFRNATIRTKTEAEHGFQLTFLNMLGNVKLFLMSLCAALGFTILLVSANTMAMLIRERIPEVGVLKTLGFKTATIVMLLLGEAVVLALAGGTIGSLLAMGLIAWVRSLPALILQLNTLSLTPLVLAALLASGVLLAVLSCLIPAVSAARRPSLACLKFNE